MKVLGFSLALGIAHLASAQYAGPAILSRGEAPGSISLPAIKFRPFVDVSALYSTGLAGVILDDTGRLANSASHGVRLAFGVSGAHRWRRSVLTLDYRGSISHYARRTYYDGMSHSLLLGFRHAISRNVILTLTQTAGMFTRDFGLLGMSQTSLHDPATTYIPTTDYFDNRTMYLHSAAHLMVRKTARLSFVFGGAGIVNSRRSRSLQSSNGVTATGDMQYRLTRRTTLGGAYQYNHFVYPRAVGGADVHAFSGSYSTAFSLRTEFSAYAGVSRIEAKSLVSGAPDPVIAALLGITQTSQIAHYLATSPMFGVRISRRVPQGILFGSVFRGVTPGNGLFLTSQVLGLNAGYTYLGLRRWSASALASYFYGDSLTGSTGAYNAASAGLRLSRKIGRSVHFVLGYSVRQYHSGRYANYQRLINDVSVGVGWTPGEVPLRVW